MNDSIKHFFLWTLLGIVLAAVALLIQQPWGAILASIYLFYLGKRLIKFFKAYLPITEQHKRMSQIFWGAFVLVISTSVVKFYHYNYVANTPGQAHELRLIGFDEFVCQGRPKVVGGVDHCGNRSVWGDGDWAYVTAYISVYGVDTEADAKEIANFMIEARRKSQQTHIPMDLTVFKLPRSQANSYSNTKIFHQHFDAE